MVGRSLRLKILPADYADVADLIQIKIYTMTENEISYLIRGAIFKVVKKLGAGLFENVYKHILKYELEKLGLNVKMEVPLPVFYDDIKFDIGFRIDLLINDKVIIEIKSVEKLAGGCRSCERYGVALVRDWQHCRHQGCDGKYGARD